MKFKALLKDVHITANRTSIKLEVTPEDTGSIDGLQVLMSDWVEVDLSPFQTAFEFAETAE